METNFELVTKLTLKLLQLQVPPECVHSMGVWYNDYHTHAVYHVESHYCNTHIQVVVGYAQHSSLQALQYLHAEFLRCWTPIEEIVHDSDPWKQ